LRKAHQSVIDVLHCGATSEVNERGILREGFSSELVTHEDVSSMLYVFDGHRSTLLCSSCEAHVVRTAYAELIRIMVVKNAQEKIRSLDRHLRDVYATRTHTIASEAASATVPVDGGEFGCSCRGRAVPSSP